MFVVVFSSKPRKGLIPPSSTIRWLHLLFYCLPRNDFPPTFLPHGFGPMPLVKRIGKQLCSIHHLEDKLLPLLEEENDSKLTYESPPKRTRKRQRANEDKSTFVGQQKKLIAVLDSGQQMFFVLAWPPFKTSSRS
ncbi:hypothetical protein V8G54_025285 [Vigna mungo]|uniref:Uncharacterized protein n=1 Tax=Vigna mungo TaxID=3915 RepID=A0AAQ3RQW4_VIGMU